jgi:DNA modification methylase
MREYIADESVDLTVTSPPYDNLRKYDGYSFDFEAVAGELWRVTKEGGVVVWVVGDATKNFCESMTSFKQAMYFREKGFKLLDTMIYFKKNYAPAYPKMKRYANQFEYMFVFVKGDKPKSFTPIQVEKKESTKQRYKSTAPSKFAKADGANISKVVKDNGKDTKDASNVWSYGVGQSKNGHPAIFPEKLAQDHIISWSNEGDTVLDPFMGSGTTAKMALLNDRQYVGFEVSADYCAIAHERLAAVSGDSE